MSAPGPFASFRGDAYLREAKPMQLDVSPRSGEEIEGVIKRIGQTPADVIAQHKSILSAK